MTPGRYYKVKDGQEGKCYEYVARDGAYIRSINDVQYEIFNNKNQMMGLCTEFKDSDLVQEKSLDMLSEGDVVVDRDDIERTVLFVHRPGLYLLSKYDDSVAAYVVFTTQELSKYNYTIKVELDAEELTVEEISKRLGKTIKVVK